MTSWSTEHIGVDQCLVPIVLCFKSDPFDETAAEHWNAEVDIVRRDVRVERIGALLSMKEHSSIP
jgi:hypothetical protein